jgi:ribosomal protein S18 acetylase RimI-like enzyme
MAEHTPAEPARGIRKMTAADIDAVSGLMGRAFDQDPVINFMVKQDAKRERRMRAFFEVAITRLTLPYGECYVTEAGDGATLWNPPGGRPHGLRADLALLPAMIRAAGPGGVLRAVGAFSKVEKLHPKEPHYYLLGIGVEPSRQGQGVGSSLLAPMVERLDREGIGAYLESSNERNNPLYERFGFVVREEVDLSKSGPRAWTMWRDPR